MYRTCTTHENLLASDVNLNISLIAGGIEQSIPLPDDPRNHPPTYAQRRELKSYCEKTRDDVKRMVSQSYACIVEDLAAAGNRVPIVPAPEVQKT